MNVAEAVTPPHALAFLIPWDRNTVEVCSPPWTGRGEAIYAVPGLRIRVRVR